MKVKFTAEQFKDVLEKIEKATTAAAENKMVCSIRLVVADSGLHLDVELNTPENADRASGRQFMLMR